MPFRMLRHHLAAVALLAGGAALAQDPLKSPACGQALQVLEAARATGDPAAVETSRRAATQVCLGNAEVPGQRLQLPARPARAVQPPVVISPPATTARQAPPPQASAPPPPVEVGRPLLPSNCDAAGCWVNDGTHLRHVMPRQPGSFCVPHGTGVFCP